MSSGEPQGSYAFVWRSTGDKDVYVRFKSGNVIKKIKIVDRTVSHAEYKNVKKGQSYSKVKKSVREGSSGAIAGGQ